MYTLSHFQDQVSFYCHSSSQPSAPLTLLEDAFSTQTYVRTYVRSGSVARTSLQLACSELDRVLAVDYLKFFERDNDETQDSDYWGYAFVQS